MITIQPETEAHIAGIQHVHEQAFGTPNEAQMVARLRQETLFNPDLSLVALDGEDVVGHVLFFPVMVEQADGASVDAIGLAPVGVLPSYQKQGIGKQLIRTGLDTCQECNYSRVVVLGDSNYYHQFGFRTAQDFGLRDTFDAPPEAFMALELIDGAWDGIRGTVHYHPIFEELD